MMNAQIQLPNSGIDLSACFGDVIGSPAPNIVYIETHVTLYEPDIKAGDIICLDVSAIDPNVHGGNGYYLLAEVEHGKVGWRGCRYITRSPAGLGWRGPFGQAESVEPGQLAKLVIAGRVTAALRPKRLYNGPDSIRFDMRAWKGSHASHP